MLDLLFPEPAAQATVEMGENNDNRDMSKVYIPYFNPESEKISARAWIAFVELARDAAGTKKEGDVDVPKWSDKMTCTNAMLLLQGTAAKWIENILENKGEELTIWETFKSSFKERFVRALTLTEKLNLTDLRMSSIESCRDFYDRCNNNFNLFFDDEWETLVKDTTTEGLPWVAPNTKVTDAHITASKIFYQKAKAIQLKLGFANGLRDSIKKQVLFQEADTVAAILKIAQRVESWLKEVKREVAILDVGDSEEDSADVGAVNFKQKKKNYQGGAGKGGQSGSSPLKCFYCLKTGHFKKNCITMKNDRKKGIFKTNINSQPAKARMNSVDAGDDDETLDVNNCQADLSEYLNFHSV